MGFLDVVSNEISWLFGGTPESSAPEPEPIEEEAPKVSVNPLEAARPKTFADFVGNQSAVNTLKAEMAGANRFRDGRMRNSLLYGPPGCVDGSTILTGSKKTIRELCEEKIAPVVLTRHGPAQAEVPFRKGKAIMYEITTESGASIKAIGKHLCLTPAGWVYVSDLVPGTELLSTPLSDVPHLTKKALNSLSCYRHDPDFCDEQPRPDVKNVQGAAPSPSDVREPGHDCSQMDDLEPKAIYSHVCRRCDPPSKPGYSFRWAGTHDEVFGGDAGNRERAYGSTQQSLRCLLSLLRQPPSEQQDRGCGNTSRPFPSQRLFVCQPFSNGILPPQLLSRVLVQLHSDAINACMLLRLPPAFHRAYSRAYSYSSPFDCYYTVHGDRVKQISEIGIREYYDLHVPGHEHYHAGGLWHHNTGKTTLSEIIAAEQGYELISTTGSAIKTPMDLYKILFRVNLEGLLSGKVFCVFFDEIHDLMRTQGISEGEYLTLFERGVFNCPSLDGKTIAARDLDGQMFQFTIGNKLVIEAPWVAIGATTEPGLLTPAMRRRFPCEVFMRPYTEDDMYEIIKRYEKALHVSLDEDAARLLAARARANPARAIGLLQFCENRCAVEDTMAITRHLAAQEMKAQGIMNNGLTELDVRVLDALASSPQTRNGEPSGLGLATLAGMIGVSTNTISELCEPYLKQLRLMAVTSRRKITPAGIEFLETVK